MLYRLLTYICCFGIYPYMLVFLSLPNTKKVLNRILFINILLFCVFILMGELFGIVSKIMGFLIITIISFFLFIILDYMKKYFFNDVFNSLEQFILLGKERVFGIITYIIKQLEKCNQIVIFIGISILISAVISIFRKTAFTSFNNSIPYLFHSILFIFLLDSIKYNINFIKKYIIENKLESIDKK